MNISTPVDEKIKNDLVIDDGEIIKKSLVVAEKLDVYLDDLKVVIKKYVNFFFFIKLALNFNINSANLYG